MDEKAIFELVDQIPENGEWWKHDAGETYRKAAAKLVSLGLKPEEAADMLDDLYWAAAGEFGA